jgi:hypothetical protein
VFAVNPVMELKNVPVPVPSAVHTSDVVGLTDVLQQTPLAIMDAPPSDVTLPPPLAVVCVIDETNAVIIVGERIVVTLRIRLLLESAI